MSGAYHVADDKVLPHAHQVADPFHVMRLAKDRLDDVRSRVQDETLGHRGCKRDLSTEHADCSPRPTNPSATEAEHGSSHSSMPATPHGEVRLVWHAEETVRGIYKIDNCILAFEYTNQLATDLQDRSCPPEVNRLRRTITRWSTQMQHLARNGVPPGGRTLPQRARLMSENGRSVLGRSPVGREETETEVLG